jgi:DNA-directed RNA polymerase
MDNKKLSALIRWENYIRQFPKLAEYWLMVPEPAKTLFNLQIDAYAQHFQDTINELEAEKQKLKENNRLLIEGLAEEMVRRKGGEDQIKRLEFMVEKGLSWKDMENDNKPSFI